MKWTVSTAADTHCDISVDYHLTFPTSHLQRLENVRRRLLRDPLRNRPRPPLCALHEAADLLPDVTPGEVLVELDLQGAEVHEAVLDDLGGEVRQHLLLGAPQQERHHLPTGGFRGFRGFGVRLSGLGEGFYMIGHFITDIGKTFLNRLTGQQLENVRRFRAGGGTPPPLCAAAGTASPEGFKGLGVMRMWRSCRGYENL
jgi:hypothetical protein